ncbi:hypothetical protein ARMGADRAFT_1038229 [Armillaria gallica]|uniref:Uncharacterized protein n=1 Tax=Armillaria gallica TaxID=47427 RepID=A0A2H3CIR3_ARMGA|nr:hypothetical protein ARMGADRAFT_1038229 [Armillaria gallica]
MIYGFTASVFDEFKFIGSDHWWVLEMGDFEIIASPNSIQLSSEQKMFLANNTALFHILESFKYEIFVEGWFQTFHMVFVLHWPPVDQSQDGLNQVYEASFLLAIKQGLRDPFHELDENTKAKELKRVGSVEYRHRIIYSGEEIEVECLSLPVSTEGERSGRRRVQRIELFSSDRSLAKNRVGLQDASSDKDT